AGRLPVARAALYEALAGRRRHAADQRVRRARHHVAARRSPYRAIYCHQYASAIAGRSGRRYAAASVRIRLVAGDAGAEGPGQPHALTLAGRWGAGWVSGRVESGEA